MQINQHCNRTGVVLQISTAMTSKLNTYLLLLSLLAASVTTAQAQERVYNIDLKRDLAILGAQGSLTAWGFYRLSQKDGTPEAEVLALNFEEDVNGFDNSWGPHYDDDINKASDIPFYGTMGLPLVFLAGNKTRSHFGDISIVFLNSVFAHSILYTTVNTFSDRKRPLVYSNEAPLSERTDSGATNSFFAGHVGSTAAASFAAAKIFADYYPDKKVGKVIAYSAASALTGTVGYMRHKAGKHFYSDIVVGGLVGTACGILIPQWYKKKDGTSLSFQPMIGQGQGLALVWQL